MKSLNDKWWAIYEAAFEITGYDSYNEIIRREDWPKLLYLTTISPPLDDISHFNLPEDLVFETSDYGKPFEKVYNALKKAVETGELSYKTHFIEKVMYFVKPFDVMLWALCKGYILPKVLQEAIGLEQPSEIHFDNASLLKVKKKITAQLILTEREVQTLDELYKLVNDYLYIFSTDLSATRKTLKELFNNPVKSGRPKKFQSKDSKNSIMSSYQLKAIPDVIKRDIGSINYNFPHLQVAFETAASFIACTYGYEKLLNKEIYLKAFFENPVVNLYLIDNHLIIKLWQKCIDKIFIEMSIVHGMNSLAARKGLKMQQ
jgi:hypothetical protein